MMKCNVELSERRHSLSRNKLLLSKANVCLNCILLNKYNTYLKGQPSGFFFFQSASSSGHRRDCISLTFSHAWSNARPPSSEATQLCCCHVIRPGRGWSSEELRGDQSDVAELRGGSLLRSWNTSARGSHPSFQCSSRSLLLCLMNHTAQCLPVLSQPSWCAVGTSRWLVKNKQKEQSKLTKRCEIFAS